MSPAVGWLMKETLAREMRRQEGNTLQVNTIIDFIQMKSVVLYSESDAGCLQSVISIISFPNRGGCLRPYSVHFGLKHTCTLSLLKSTWRHDARV